jgi:hypothetical protein
MGCGSDNAHGPDSKKFFASFFQKRSACFNLGGTFGEAAGGYIVSSAGAG